MDKFLPDIYQKSIYTIDYNNLKKSGIKCLIFDLENTLASANILVPIKKNKELFEDLKDMGFRILIVSNESKKRVEPFKNKLNVDAAYHSFKPLKKKYKKIIKYYRLNEEEIACIGDQIITDVYGANRMNMTSILVNPISSIDVLPTKVVRIFEKLIIKILEKKGKFSKGEYYE